MRVIERNGPNYLFILLLTVLFGLIHTFSNFFVGLCIRFIIQIPQHFGFMFLQVFLFLVTFLIIPLFLLELHNFLFCLVVFGLFVSLPAVSYKVSYGFEFCYDLLCYLQLHIINVLILNVFYGSPHECFIYAFAQQRAGLENEFHLFFCQVFLSWKVLI